MKTIYDEKGNVFEYNPVNGLIAKNNVIVSGADYEPLFCSYPDNSRPPCFVGIYLPKEGRVIGMSGKISKIINSRSL